MRKSFFFSLQVLYFALLAGQVMVCLVLYSMFPINQATLYQEDFWLQAIAIFCLAIAGLSMVIRNRLIQQARTQASLPHKLSAYRIACIISWALVESATMVSIVFFFISSRMEFFYLALCAIGFFLTLIPRREKMISELDLSSSEIAELEQS